ncbi:hypothetical protein B0H14DRAFT_3582772 [Mycena olivaceomarginata]|nr:hypothetical protein B0H14DRAFT_3582772 [Mycena olivaceomarginata]
MRRWHAAKLACTFTVGGNITPELAGRSTCQHKRARGLRAWRQHRGRCVLRADERITVALPYHGENVRTSEGGVAAATVPLSAASTDDPQSRALRRGTRGLADTHGAEEGCAAGSASVAGMKVGKLQVCEPVYMKPRLDPASTTYDYGAGPTTRRKGDPEGKTNACSRLWGAHFARFEAE